MSFFPTSSGRRETPHMLEARLRAQKYSRQMNRRNMSAHDDVSVETSDLDEEDDDGFLERDDDDEEVCPCIRLNMGVRWVNVWW